MNPTESQKRAIETLDADVCVTAGAGSGKTLVLAQRYLEILRGGGAGVSGIVAITFTEKAAREMRDRIRGYCDEEIKSAGNPEELRKWRRHKRDLESARISTIHGFCSGILRENPVEAGVDPAFSVIDENAAMILAAQVVDDSVEALLNAKDGNIRRVIDIYGVRPAKRILHVLLGRLEDANNASRFLQEHDNRQLLEIYRERLIEVQAELAHQLSAQREWREQISVLALDTISVRSAKMRQMQTQAIKADQVIHSSTDDEKAAGALSDILGINLKFGNKKNWEERDHDVDAALKSLKGMVEEHKAIISSKIEEKDVKNIQLARDLAAVHASALERYRRAKDEAGMLTFEDLEIKTRDLLAGNEDVRRELHGHIRFILVDEFQDISPIQRDIIWLLAGRSGADKGRGKRPNLFLVGDDKQSIYRFRGADVEVFTKARKDIDKKGRVVLDTNFRTVEQGVEFANILFGELMHEDRATRDYHAVYQNIAPFRGRLPDGPFTELSLLTYEEKQKPGADELRLMEARAVAQKILELTSSGWAHVFDGKTKQWITPKYGHIAVIFRKLAHRIHLYERAFQEADIPYHVTAGSDFYARQEVRDVLNMLRAIDNPRDDYALAGVLRSPMFAMSDEALYWLAAASGDSFAEKFYSGGACSDMAEEEREKLDFARKAVQRLQSLKDRLALPQIIKRILDVTGLEAVLATTFNGMQKIANLRKMIEVARSFEASGIFSLHDFIRYINEFLTQETRESQAAIEEEERNVVRIMTVHKAKGLEFPIVIIPDICPLRQGGSDKASIGLSREFGLVARIPERAGSKPSNGIHELYKFDEKLKDDAESKRLLYVATTRAKDGLFLSGCIEKGKVPPGWLGYIADALSLDTGDAGKAAPPCLNIVEKDAAEFARVSPRPKGRATDIKTIIEIMREVRPEDASADLPQWRRVNDIPPYAHCPRKYYYEFVCGYPQIRARTEGSGVLPGVMVGTVAHRLFETLQPGDSEEQIAQAIGAEGEFTETEREGLAKTLRGFLEKFDASPLSGVLAGARETWREARFVAKCGDALLEGKMDLMFRDEEGSLHILDYKSDYVRGEDFDEKLRRYRLQLAAYALGVRAALGEAPKSARLYFFRYGASTGLPISEKDVEEFEGEIMKVISAIRANRFDRLAPAPCKCGYEWLCRREPVTGV
jgi:ATP-dependent helicase/nuclease subunit A